ncbi:hypothetical protein DVH24_010497 [Malus domestica]|uniref:Uncharacterized protein n=1 Tax=Malus domestica TaxID=3750 RepID=A0A498JXG4_MALDO|nr:hypothetical protein DVH24_010497 [Malus domestica]
MNVDGSRKSGKECSSASGILREWIAGFTINIGVGSVLNDELWGLFRDFSLAWRLAHLITACRELLRKDWICMVSHVYHEKNRVVDGLADLGHKFDIGLYMSLLFWIG